MNFPDLPQAACAGMDGEAWFPETGGDGDLALRICAFCPEKQPCLQWALDNKETFGIWGGLTMMQRVHLSYPKNRRRPTPRQAVA